jgi:hypothetical protein
MPENLIERYLTEMGEVRSTRSNVAETSFYPALERLLSDIGKSLSPKVRGVINLANRASSHGSCCLAAILGRQLPERDPDDLPVDEAIGMASCRREHYGG